MALDSQNLFDRQRAVEFDGLESARRALSASMPSRKKTRTPVDAQAERLQRLREMLGYDQSATFAVGFLDVSPQRWNHFENGKPISREMVFKLVQAVPGLTADWLYFGKADGLPLELARRLGEIGAPGKRTTA